MSDRSDPTRLVANALWRHLKPTYDIRREPESDTWITYWVVSTLAGDPILRIAYRHANGHGFLRLWLPLSYLPPVRWADSGTIEFAPAAELPAEAWTMIARQLATAR